MVLNACAVYRELADSSRVSRPRRSRSSLSVDVLTFPCRPSSRTRKILRRLRRGIRVSDCLGVAEGETFPGGGRRVGHRSGHRHAGGLGRGPGNAATPPTVNAVSQSATVAVPPERVLLNRYCGGCHNSRTKSGNFVLDTLDVTRVADDVEAWEKVVRKLRGGLMPPARQPRPDEATYAKLLATLQERLDAAAAARANPGRTETVHRLNRLEYENAVRDLLAVDINAADLLPADDSSYGFDNIAGVLKMSPALMERYLSAARVVSRSAVGSPPPPGGCCHLPGDAGAAAARSARRPAVRHARRHVDSSCLPAECGVRPQDLGERRPQRRAPSRISSKSRSTASQVKVFTLASARGTD